MKEIRRPIPEDRPVRSQNENRIEAENEADARPKTGIRDVLDLSRKLLAPTAGHKTETQETAAHQEQ